jgi:hypothetical protein
MISVIKLSVVMLSAIMLNVSALEQRRRRKSISCHSNLNFQSNCDLQPNQGTLAERDDLFMGALW